MSFIERQSSLNTDLELFKVQSSSASFVSRCVIIDYAMQTRRRPKSFNVLALAQKSFRSQLKTNCGGHVWNFKLSKDFYLKRTMWNLKHVKYLKYFKFFFVLTFLWFQMTFTLGLPRRENDWSMTSSWIKLAEWIISAIMAIFLWAFTSCGLK